MNTLSEKIKAFNSAVTTEWNQVQVAGPATPDEVQELKLHLGLPMPADLEALYLAFGGLSTEEDESRSLDISPPRFLIEKLKKEGFYWKLHSMGLVDMIRFSWANDRPEFNSVDPQKVALVNERYKCFGLYRRDWGLEEADYLYFDAQGKFGVVRYHQDDFDDLWEGGLLPMLDASPAHEELPAMLVRILDDLQALILDDED